jgi:hypothetical protein
VIRRAVTRRGSLLVRLIIFHSLHPCHPFHPSNSFDSPKPKPLLGSAPR